MGKAVLFNLTGGGARVVDVRVPVPETTKSHAVLVTGSSGTDPLSLGPTIFDAARQKGYLCIAILERGDSMPILQKQDAVLYLGDNAIHGAEPIPGLRAQASTNLSGLLQVWRDRFGEYTKAQGEAGYAGYNAWGLDAAADVVEHLGNQPFLMLVNVGAVDSAGQDLGADGYLETVRALDAPLGRLAEACRKNGTLLVVTADHGMCFPGSKGKGGHSAAKYADRRESLRVPLVFSGPGIEELNLAGRWSQVDIAPTVLDLLNISANLSMEGKSIPISQSYDLRVTGAPAGLELWRGEERLAGGIRGRRVQLPGPLARAVHPQGGRQRMGGAGEWRRCDGSGREGGIAGRHQEDIGGDPHSGHKSCWNDYNYQDSEKRIALCILWLNDCRPPPPISTIFR